MSDMDSVREILERVANGELDPTEAARLLDEQDAAARREEEPAGPSAPAGSVVTPEIARVEVAATSRRVRIVADPTVATVVVHGGHTVRRDGSTLHVTGDTELVPTEDAFTLLAGGGWRGVADRLQNVGQGLELTVRVRPDLPVAAEVIGGSLQAADVPRLDHVRVTAGSLRVQGSQHPIDVLVQAGSAQIETRQTYGRSRFRCESGSMQLTFVDGSDVRIRSDVQLGRFATEPERRGRDRNRDVVVGTGAAEVDVHVVMGHVTVRLPQREQPEDAA